MKCVPQSNYQFGIGSSCLGTWSLNGSKAGPWAVPCPSQPHVSTWVNATECYIMTMPQPQGQDSPGKAVTCGKSSAACSTWTTHSYSAKFGAPPACIEGCANCGQRMSVFPWKKLD
eukprot:6614445-Pyramimonas_sp.AAC.1